jgi:glycosyl hydrolase family 115 (putative glucuronidase)/glycosyl hydrolase family 20
VGLGKNVEKTFCSFGGWTSIATGSLMLIATASFAAESGLRLSGAVTISNTTALPGVALATKDLASDLRMVLGERGRIISGEEAQIVIFQDDTIRQPEGYRIDVGKDAVRIAGADELGVIYAIYRFSRDFLGVDPYWYFKDLEPEPRKAVVVPLGVIQSKPPTVRYRGWFVNDEDLFTEWKSGGGERFIDYPFYRQVSHIDVIDRVFEALLRAGGNLVIPASFVDVMNEPEARLIQRAVERGLYVTQHHIEPLGVSHYGFENYWKAKGQDYAFAYGSNPDQVRQVWRAFAQRWHDLAGDKVVWQLGLRGKADRAIWLSDKSVSQSQAGTFISQAIAEQWQIVRSVDPRPTPPATTTLWLEGSHLMSKGVLSFPDGITIVFADEGSTQTMQDDFRNTPRNPNRRYGVYYHIGFWGTGPHLLQGSRPDRIRREFDKVLAKGDTEYAIINVCNVREHVLGIQAATEIMTDRDTWSEPQFWTRFAPQTLHDDYEELLANLVPTGEDRIMQDGALFATARRMLTSYAKGNTKSSILSSSTVTERKRQLADSIDRLDALAARYPAHELTSLQRPFYDVHLLTQTKMWRDLYAFYLAVIEAQEDPGTLKDAEQALERFLQIRKAAESGKWKNWYRGDKKVNVPEFLNKTRAARERLE